MVRISFFILAALVGGCGGSGKSPKKLQGGEGQVCYSDGSCNTNLFCVEDYCRANNVTPNNITPNNINPNNITPNNINPNNQSFCNDGVLDAGEVCDGADLNGQSCVGLGFDSGALGCSSQCTFDMSNCTTAIPPVCGNNLTEAGELCDGTDLRGADCMTQGFAGGTLGCDDSCNFFDTSGCGNNACGNGFIEGGELCDGADLGGETCESRGFDAGTLRCNSACAAFNTDLCSVCGNDVVEGAEACDGANVNGQTCTSLGLDAGALGCNSACTDYDTSLCTADLVCMLSAPDTPPCDVNDLVACLCEGCVNDGDCAGGLLTPTDDCVCPDCRADGICSNAQNCVNDGKCDPYLEGCVCADCAAHPQCQITPP